MIEDVLAEALLAFLAILAVGYTFRRQREGYELLISTLERDRDQARAEAATYRRMILPRFDLASVNQPSGVAAPTPTPLSAMPARAPESGASTPSAAPQPFRDRRIPTRVWMKQMAARFNSKQQRVDAIAEQITQQRQDKEKVV